MGSNTTGIVAATFVLAGLVFGHIAPAGTASADPPAPPAPKTTIDHDGTYSVGTDVLPGTYSSAGPVGSGTCYWKRVGGPNGNEIVDNALSKKPQVVRIEPGDKVFKTDGCQPWQNAESVNAQAPTDIPGPAAAAQLQINLGILNGLLAPSGAGQVPQP